MLLITVRNFKFTVKKIFFLPSPSLSIVKYIIFYYIYHHYRDKCKKSPISKLRSNLSIINEFNLHYNLS